MKMHRLFLGIAGLWALASFAHASPLLEGDLDADGKITLADARQALKLALGQSPSSPELIALGDVAPRPSVLSPGDGKIDLRDVSLILQASVGLLGENGLGSEPLERTFYPRPGVLYRLRINGTEFTRGQMILMTVTVENQTDHWIEWDLNEMPLSAWASQLDGTDVPEGWGSLAVEGGALLQPGESASETGNWDQLQYHDPSERTHVRPGLYGIRLSDIGGVYFPGEDRITASEINLLFNPFFAVRLLP